MKPKSKYKKRKFVFDLAYNIIFTIISYFFIYFVRYEFIKNLILIYL